MRSTGTSCALIHSRIRTQTRLSLSSAYRIRPQGTNRGQGPLQGINLIGPIFFSVGRFLFIFHIRVRRCMLDERAKGLVLNRPS
jgi:hypothetical protein